jgi:endonuclease/exonuclease/phosphatase family metal-dependent hydrolase
MALRIVSHNAFWFQGASFPSDSPGPPDRRVLNALAELHASLAPDVLCIQEIQDAETFAALAAAVGMDGCYSPGRELPQYGGATLWRSPPASHADWRDAGAAPQRMWQVVALPGAHGFVVANVHLPSARQLPKETAQQRRLAELEALLSRDPRPDVIAGDLNEQPGGPVGELLRSHGYADAAEAAGQAGAATKVGGGRGDYVWLSAAATGRLMEYGVAGGEGFWKGVSGKEPLSDHLPLWVSLDAGPPRG